MLYLGLTFLLSIFLILETSAFSMPFLIIGLIAVTVVFKNYISFLFALVFGIMLDVLTFKTIGISSFLFIILVFIIFSYQKKFEITTNYFVIFASFLAGLIFSFIFGLNHIIFQSIVSVVLGVTAFQFLKKINIEKQISNS
ncbi:MAG: hypothetical protein COU25_03595 [Candidatus Levybacteria bacterium CG10_big_fil_rev_8_21_14_0_10_35_13]|nr:MAG: hypothetical protein COU25_03595 [Candidatus Levybacteria bacterium CG10_big_fil_rev_8_21_14_0_10_35_13]